MASGAKKIPTLEEDIAEVVKLAHSTRKEGIESILTNGGRLKPSHLKRVSESHTGVNTLEETVERITLAILNRRMDALDAITIHENQALVARGRPPFPLLDREEVLRSVKENADGKSFYIETVMQALGADCACVSTHRDARGLRTDSVQLSLPEKSALRQARIIAPKNAQQSDALRRENAERLNTAVEPIPLVKHVGTDDGGHFETLIPVRLR